MDAKTDYDNKKYKIKKIYYILVYSYLILFCMVLYTRFFKFNN